MSTQTSNSPSILLEKEENDEIFNNLNKNTTSIVTAVVQLFLTEPPDHAKWNLKFTGVLLLMRDSYRKSYFIRVLKNQDWNSFWEQEIYDGFTFLQSKPNFITFEAETCMAGLNFASNVEAKDFSAQLNKKIKKLETAARTISPEKKTISRLASVSKPEVTKKVKKKKKQITKDDIGEPTGFKHLSHIGFDPKKGFDLDNIEPAWSKLFKSIGVTENILKDKETSNFIYDFVQNSGGIDKMMKEIDLLEQENKPIPTVSKPSLPSRSLGARRNAAPPPSLPERSSVVKNMAAPTRQESLDRSQPILKSSRLSSFRENHKAAPTRNGSCDIHPPLPPPLPSRQAITSQDSIRSSQVASTPRGTMLDQIRQGATLRANTASNASESRPSKADCSRTEGGMVGLLTQRLNMMRLNIEEEAKTESSGEEEEDEWDD